MIEKNRPSLRRCNTAIQQNTAQHSTTQHTATTPQYSKTQHNTAHRNTATTPQHCNNTATTPQHCNNTATTANNHNNDLDRSAPMVNKRPEGLGEQVSHRFGLPRDVTASIPDFDSGDMGSIPVGASFFLSFSPFPHWASCCRKTINSMRCSRMRLLIA